MTLADFCTDLLTARNCVNTSGLLLRRRKHLAPFFSGYPLYSISLSNSDSYINEVRYNLSVCTIELLKNGLIIAADEMMTPLAKIFSTLRNRRRLRTESKGEISNFSCSQHVGKDFGTPLATSKCWRWSFVSTSSLYCHFLSVSQPAS